VTVVQQQHLQAFIVKEETQGMRETAFTSEYWFFLMAAQEVILGPQPRHL
jgi:hypothetical protein